MTWPSDELLTAAADAPADGVERHLLIIAAIESILGKQVIVVGGMAVNVFVRTYQPTDIDLVGAVTLADRELLVEHGFSWGGIGHRHLSLVMPDGEIVLVEFPDDVLDGVYPPVWHEITAGVGVWMISLVDLVIDRLVQATDGTPVTWDAAVHLVAATFDRIDWSCVLEVAHSPDNAVLGVPDLAVSIRKEAAQRLGIR